MAIINSCCFWKSLKKGSIASAIYSFIYFTMSALAVAIHLYSEKDFLVGNVEKPVGISFLSPTPSTSSINVIVSLPLLGCSLAGSIASVLAIIGLRKDQREFLVPFIFIMLVDLIFAIGHFIYLVIFGEMKFQTLNGIIFTIDFFAICLNLYCLVCIVSQYQEYKSEELLSSTNHYIINNGIVSYKAQQPEKSCIILHQSKTSPMNNGHTNFTLIQETQKNGSAIGIGLKSPFQRRKPKSTLLLKKQVKFTDDFKCCTDNSLSLNGAEKISEDEDESNSNSKSLENDNEEENFGHGVIINF